MVWALVFVQNGPGPIGHKLGTPCHGHIVPGDGRVVKYGDESQICRLWLVRHPEGQLDSGIACSAVLARPLLISHSVFT
jgi:hypothetical protein